MDPVLLVKEGGGGRRRIDSALSLRVGDVPGRSNKEAREDLLEVDDRPTLSQRLLEMCVCDGDDSISLFLFGGSANREATDA